MKCSSSLAVVWVGISMMGVLAVKSDGSKQGSAPRVEVLLVRPGANNRVIVF